MKNKAYQQTQSDSKVSQVEIHIKCKVIQCRTQYLTIQVTCHNIQWVVIVTNSQIMAWITNFQTHRMILITDITSKCQREWWLPRIITISTLIPQLLNKLFSSSQIHQEDWLHLCTFQSLVKVSNCLETLHDFNSTSTTLAT